MKKLHNIYINQKNAILVILEKVKEQKDWAANWQHYGTRRDVVTLSKLSILPTRNWRSGVFEGAEGICFVNAEKEWTWKTVPCGPLCPTPCSDYIEIDKGPYLGAHCDGPEYETLYAFGSNCGIDKLDALVAADQLCDENSLDTMSAGLSISFAMECFEKGLISLTDTDGVELRFGDDKAMLTMLRKIIAQDGLGKELGKGVRWFSAQVGQGSQAFAMHAKGLELGGYECRGLNGQALQFAIDNRGGCHHGYGLPARAEAFEGTGLQVQGKGQQVKNMAIGQIINDCLPSCSFARTVASAPDLALTSLLGEEWTPAMVSEVGMRIMCQERLFNMREGLTRKDDSLPDRLLKEPKPDGLLKGAAVPLEQLKDDYYQALGWDPLTGNPPDALLEKLGIKK